MCSALCVTVKHKLKISYVTPDVRKISASDLSNVGCYTLRYIKIVTEIKSTNILMQRMLF